MNRTFRYLILFLIIALITAGILFTIFFRRLTSGDFRPQLESKLSEWLGLKTELGPLSFTWKSALGLDIRDLRLRERGGEIPLLEADDVFFLLDPFSVFHQRLVFYEFKLRRPRITLVRRKDGKNNWEREGKGSRVSKAAGGLAFLFSRVRLEEGYFHYRDETKFPPLNFEAKEIHAVAEQDIPGGTISLEGEGRVSGGSPSDIKTRVTIHPGTGETHFENHFQGDQIMMKGEAFPFQKPVRFRSTIKVKELNLDPLYNLKVVVGVADGEFEIGGVLADLEETKESLRGKGQLEIHNGAFRGVNVAASVLRRITVIPGVEGVLTGALPAPLQQVFRTRDTPFELLQVAFTIQDNQAVIRPFLLKNPHYLVQVEGTIGLKGELNLRGHLILLEDLSRFLVGRVKELSSLENSEGRMVIPFVYRGYWPEARPLPDLASITQKLVVEHGTRWVEKGMEFLSQLGKPQN